MTAHRRQEFVDRLGAMFALIVAGQTAVFVMPAMIAIAIDSYPASESMIVYAIRWAALIPALIYAGACILSFSVPSPRQMRTISSRSRRLPRFGRFSLLAIGFVGSWSCIVQSMFLATEDAPYQWSGGIVYIIYFGMALMVLRPILGALRLIPRSWRIAPESDTPIDLPDQKFAPRRATE